MAAVLSYDIFLELYKISVDRYKISGLSCEEFVTHCEEVSEMLCPELRFNISIRFSPQEMSSKVCSRIRHAM